jgi:hypothetical protein
MKSPREIAASPYVLFFAAAFSRLAASVYILEERLAPQQLFVKNEPSHIAAALATGLGFSSPYANTPISPSAQQPPLYPLLLAAVFKVFGVYSTCSAWVIVCIHIIAGSVTAVVIFRLGKTYFGDIVAIVAAWAWVVPWMFQIRSFNVSLTNAYISGLGFAALLLWLPRVLQKDQNWFWIGACAGLLLLLQPAFLPVFLVYGTILALSQFRSFRMWLAVAGLLAVLAPWTVRNYVVMRSVVPIRDNFGLELWLGNRPGMEGALDYSEGFPGNDPRQYTQLGEIKFMEEKSQEARSFIMSEPLAFINRCLHRVVEFWYVPYPFFWIAISALGWLGAVLACRKHDWGWIFAAPLAVFPLVYYVTHVYAGYRYPIEPIIILLAAYASVEFISYLRRQLLGEEASRNSAGQPGAVLLAIAFTACTLVRYSAQSTDLFPVARGWL